MWQWLWIASLCASAFASSETGPKSREEAAILWEQGRTSFLKNDFAEAVGPLKRLTDRYPAEKGFLEAHLLLGLAWLEMDKPERSIAPLRYFHDANQRTDAGLKASLALSRAYAESRRFSESLLLADEALTWSKTNDKRSEAMIRKAQALIGLNQDARAEAALDSFRKGIEQATVLSSPTLTAQAAWIEIQLKLRACKLLASKTPLEEALTRAQFRARGQCLQEALNLLRDATDRTTGERWMTLSRDALLNAIDSYLDLASHPPRPPGKRTKAQLQSYLQELSVALKEDYKVFSKQFSSLLGTWKEKSPANSSRYIDPLLKKAAI